MGVNVLPGFFQQILTVLIKKKTIKKFKAVKKSIATIYRDVAYDFLFHLINSVTMETNHEYMNYDYNLINHN